MSTPPLDTEPSVGIDLGTTNSAIATATQGGLRLIERKTGQRLMPSMVGALPDGQRVVGEEARALAEREPSQVAYATKRFIGQRWSPELATHCRQTYPFAVVGGRAGDIRVKLSGQTFPVAQLSAMVLSELRADAEAWFDCEVRKAVITVPAAFTDTQRQATREAAAIAGLEVLRLVNEPTAAAMAYGLATGFTGNVVVFDLGGGTFDVSALSVKDGVFEVVATDGDPDFGGEDFDHAVVQWMLEQLSDAPSRERVRQSPRAMAQLKAAAESAKIALSTLQRHPVALNLRLEDKGKVIPLGAELTRQTFEALVREKTAHCLGVVERTLTAARWAESDVESVLLVGGMTRAPLVRSLVAARFGRLPRATVNPDEAVALGAAVHAAELVEKRGGALLLDVVGSSLGVGVAGGLTQPLIPRNTMLPCHVQHTFFPSQHAQQVVRLPIVQGEDRRTQRNVALGELVLEGLRGTTRDESAISVTFSLSQDGVLAVSASDAGTGAQKSLTLNARAGLSSAEAERLAERERAHRAASVRTPLDERARAREARRALRQVVVALRRIQLQLAQRADDDGDAEAASEAQGLAQRLVEAERVEVSGTKEEALALAAALLDSLRRYTAAPNAPQGSPVQALRPPAQQPALAPSSKPGGALERAPLEDSSTATRVEGAFAQGGPALAPVEGVFAAAVGASHPPPPRTRAEPEPGGPITGEWAVAVGGATLPTPAEAPGPEAAAGWEFVGRPTAPPGLRDALAFLGLAHDATVSQARRAYRALIALVHPDRGGCDPERAALLNRAWQIVRSQRLASVWSLPARSKPWLLPAGAPAASSADPALQAG